LFFSPLVAMIGSYPPLTAPALVIVGAMMMQNVARIDWQDHTESPARLPYLDRYSAVPTPSPMGLALGFISYPLIKLLSDVDARPAG